MTAEQLVGRFYEDFDNNRIDAAVAAFAEDVEIVDPGKGTVHGRERFREYLETFKRAMPTPKPWSNTDVKQATRSSLRAGSSRPSRDRWRPMTASWQRQAPA